MMESPGDLASLDDAQLLEYLQHSIPCLGRRQTGRWRQKSYKSMLQNS